VLTRTKAQEGKPTQVYGALIGKQAGRDVEICNSFELDYTIIEGQVTSFGNFSCIPVL
jgi:COP9 signalosome complex subunit 6